MSQPRQVYTFAKGFLDSNTPLSILVNNAGCMVNEREVVEGNIEVNFSTNTLGTHILTKTLLPLIAQAEKPRVVNKTLLIALIINIFKRKILSLLLHLAVC